MARVRYSGTSPDERVMARVNRVVRGIATVDMKPLEERLVDAARVALRLDRTGSDREVRKRHSLAQPRCRTVLTVCWQHHAHATIDMLVRDLRTYKAREEAVVVSRINHLKAGLERRLRGMRGRGLVLQVDVDDLEQQIQRRVHAEMAKVCMRVQECTTC